MKSRCLYSKCLKKAKKKAHLNKMFDLKLLLNSFSPYYKWQMRCQTKLTSVSLLFPAVFQHYTHINWNYQNHIFTFLKYLLNWKFQIASFCTHGSLLTCSHSTGGNTSIMWTDMKRDSWDRGRQYEIWNRIKSIQLWVELWHCLLAHLYVTDAQHYNTARHRSVFFYICPNKGYYTKSLLF